MSDLTEDDRKPWYGQDGEQPWDTIKRLGWAPQFAASNVLKYLRRTKDPDHSLESARWYHARLVEMCGTSRYWISAPGVLVALQAELSPEEIARLGV